MRVKKNYNLLISLHSCTERNCDAFNFNKIARYTNIRECTYFGDNIHERGIVTFNHSSSARRKRE